MTNCPCCSGLEFKKCCEPYLKGEKIPTTAEALMRSRYTAYATHQIEYISETHFPETRDEVSLEESKKWAENSKWLGLTILKTKEGGANDKSGEVEFLAKYTTAGQEHSHHEKSLFVKIEERWYFKDGQTFPTTVKKDATVVGRNEPCPCGSGKKYKQCCGKN